MNLTLATFLKNTLELDNSCIEIHPDYSGRGMYDEKTTGLSGNFSVNCIWKLIIKYRKEVETITPLDTIDLRSDEFARGIIVY
ncbi:hypothetical protein [Pseudoalteromonas denitrificans]|uniref:Uncharacterized protein n=1 Tax=Pseudoalteromonas denitrificans DSM 6059 TaxID=1123010 RepID=A0A1I1UXS0_9GAMM|nr:hypothetical protein [Pseudoalteromonas denitrificans]SFD75597.1 hypothetical protein SAMN02745724_05370 [Pseudoalteromonas denitrificans DSM 6059]